MDDDVLTPETEATESETAAPEEKKLQFVDLAALLKPISDDKPSGEDFSFSDEFDVIKEARRFDDPKLSQGDWETDLKIADWPKVKKLCTEILTKQSKDIQVTAWLTESLGMLHGFQGLSEGLIATSQLLEQFWETIYPQKEGEDLEERVAKIEWMLTMLRDIVAVIPIGKGDKQDVGLREWREAQFIKIQTAKDSNYLSQALEEGKIDLEAFTRSIERTSNDQFTQTVQAVHSLKAEIQLFGQTMDRLFDKQSPGIRDLNKTIDELIEVVDRLAKTKLPQPKEEAEPSAEETVEVVEETASDEEIKTESSEERPLSLSTAGMVDRQQILRNLQDAADFFKNTEPHSPVSYLIERAIKWANMGLQEWLDEVVKDPSSLSFIKETLGLAVGGAMGGMGGMGGGRSSFEAPSSYDEPSPSPYGEEENQDQQRSSYEDDIDLF